jgi:hypothetical protein
MRKCPSCAVMRESITRTEIPALQQKPTDGTPEVSAIRVRCECSQMWTHGRVVCETVSGSEAWTIRSDRSRGGPSPRMWASGFDGVAGTDPVAF